MKQFSTFYLAGKLYGIEVTRVQEIVRPLPMTKVPLAPECVLGLVNLRGQVATAIGLRELFSFQKDTSQESMNVICNIEGHLIAFQVDEIGDVIEVEDDQCDPPPANLNESLKKYLEGVYKENNMLVSIIDINKINQSFAA